MAFTSIGYIVFLAAVVGIFHLVADRHRWLILLIASITFYASFNIPYLLPVLALVTGMTFGCGYLLGRSRVDTTRKALLICGITANTLVLIFMKYLQFLGQVFNQIAGCTIPQWQVAELPLVASIGVSYYVFQAISYLADVYLEIEEPERNFGHFALYLCLFPKMLQGPIERAGDLLPQLHQSYLFRYDGMRAGCFLFGFGLFKKVVIADRLAPFVNSVYGNVHDHAGLPLIIATYLYAFQLLFDFSGYTDMALGAARMFGINLTQNFNAPYRATSLADFWRRWHMSFSRWILDYIFKPLQMQLRNWKNSGTATALFVTFLISGVWHGAGWNFIAWGILHGVYMAASVFYKPWQKRIHRRLNLKKGPLLTAWQRFFTFNLVCFAWIFFRTTTITDGLYIVRNLTTGVATQFGTLVEALARHESLRSIYIAVKPFFLGQSWKELVTLIMALAIYTLIQRLSGKDGTTLFQQKPALRWAVYYALAIGIIVFGAFNSSQQFIYVQF